MAVNLPERMILNFLKPLWQDKIDTRQLTEMKKLEEVAKSRNKEWIWPVIKATKKYFPADIVNDEKAQNLFIMKTFACAKIM